MTLDSLMEYLWQMPLTGWGAIIAGCLVLAGINIYFDGRCVMKKNHVVSKATSISSDGIKHISISEGFTNDYAYGKRMSNLGIWIALFALIALIEFLRIV